MAREGCSHAQYITGADRMQPKVNLAKTSRNYNNPYYNIGLYLLKSVQHPEETFTKYEHYYVVLYFYIFLFTDVDRLKLL